MERDRVITLFSPESPSPPPDFRLEELQFGGWRRTLAIIFWGIVAFASFLASYLFNSVYIVLDGDESDEKLWSVMPPHDLAAYASAKLEAELISFGFFILFAVALCLLIRALAIPRLVRVHTMRYEPKTKRWKI